MFFAQSTLMIYYISQALGQVLSLPPEPDYEEEYKTADKWNCPDSKAARSQLEQEEREACDYWSVVEEYQQSEVQVSTTFAFCFFLATLFFLKCAVIETDVFTIQQVREGFVCVMSRGGLEKRRTVYSHLPF